MIHNHYQKCKTKHTKYQKPPINHQPNVLSLQNKCLETYYMYMYIHKRKTLFNTGTLLSYSKQVNIDSTVNITLAVRENLLKYDIIIVKLFSS